MAGAQTPDRFVVFVGLGDPIFNERVRSAIASTHGILDLSDSDDFYWRVARIDAVVVPFTPAALDESEFRALLSLPREQQQPPVYLVHLDDDRLPPWQNELKNRQLRGYCLYQIVQWSQFLGWFTRETGENHQQLNPAVIASTLTAVAGALLASPPQEVPIAFDPAVTPGQITATLTAIANYYRACGGVGLSVEFENQEAVPEEVHA
jgi:hypothetical protein